MQYVVIAIVSAFFWSLCETGFLKTYLIEYFYSKYSSDIQKELIVQDIVSITVRNMALLAIYIHLYLYEKVVKEEKDMKIASAKQLHLLMVKDKQKKDCFIEIPQLLYCKQIRNYTHYFTCDNEYTSLTTLKEIKKLVGEGCIQIGRNLLVMRHAIQDKNDTYITLHNPSDPENPIRLPVN